MVYPMITGRLLARLGACRGARRTFRRLWPNGTRANAKAVRRATNAHINLVWFGTRYLTGDAHKRFMRDANRAELMWRRHRGTGFTRSRRAERNWWKRIAKALLLGLRRMMAKPDLLAVNGIDLRPFLKKDWTPTRKYDLDTPWISYGRVNASDGRIYVAVDAPFVKVTSRDRRRPPVRKRLSFPESGTWLPWPTMHRTVDKCGRTLGGHAIVAAGFGMLDEFYADAIARLPNVEYQPPTDHEKPIYFRFTGGWGAVMEIIPPEEDKPEQAAAAVVPGSAHHAAL